MEFLFDLLQGAGLATAVGIRPFLPVLLVGALAVGDLGVDFENTDFAFLEAWPFLLGVLLLVIAADLVARRQGPEAADRGPLFVAVLAIVLVLGALVAAGSLADRGHPIAPGLAVGVAAAALGFFATRSLFLRTRRRLDQEAASALPLYAEAIGLLAAGLSVLFPPLAVLVVGGLAWLLLGGRRRAGEKYAGLRILR
jgi:hydrogenase-4 membrane subunit HyfE